jgi:hypothetical protein
MTEIKEKAAKLKNKVNVKLIDMSFLVILLFALSFCGTPDLHDKLLKYADVKIQLLEQEIK